MKKGTPSLKNHMRKLAFGWTVFWVFLAIPFSVAIFYFMQFTNAESQFATNARMITTVKRSQIFSGDIKSAELQIRKDLALSNSDRAMFLDEHKKPWLLGLESNLEKCETAEAVCSNWLKHKLVIYQPIYFDNDKLTLWGYLYVEQAPTSNWGFAVAITSFFFFIMLIQNFGFSANVVREISKVSQTLTEWAQRLLKNPKELSIAEGAPFSEIEPIEKALSQLTREIVHLEGIARKEGALTTLRGVGHDILNPVSRIKRLLGIIRAEQNSSTAVDTELFSALNQNVKRLSNYAEQLKFMYKRDLGEVSLDATFSNVSVEIQNLVAEMQFDPDVLDRKINITANIEDNCIAEIPSAALGRMVENVCANGIHASKNNSSVHINVKSLGASVVLQIQDSGSGIPNHLRSRVFEAGYTSKPNKGTGLGLFVVKQICEQYGGRIELNSRPEIGTEVNIILPRQEVAHVV